MKKHLFLDFVLAVVLVLPSIGEAAFVIHLKNGGRHITTHCWEEGQELMFYAAGGVMGIQKQSVKVIEKKPVELRWETVPVLPAPRTEVTKPITEPPDKAKAVKTEEKIDIEAYRNRKGQMTAELDRLSDKLREATRRKDQEAKNRAMEEMRAKSAEIYDLTDEVKKKNKGKLPDGWWKD